jgi:hypothetical protein
MKKILLLFTLFSVASTLNQKSLAAQNPNPPDFGMQVGFFYSSLAPHGEWIEVESGFRVWRPFHVPHQWRPYLMGQWVWTDDYGWYWVSSEPFGWITYHYGRWYYDDYYGWVWMPDNVWGPAWVEWRYDNDYVGWAPLPPYASFSFNFGIRFSTRWAAPVHYWNFVRYHCFGAIIRYRDIASVEHTRRLIRTTRTGSQYEVNHDRIINRGVDRTIIEQRGKVRISRADVREVREQSGERMTRTGGNNRTERIEIFRPTQDEMQNGKERIEARRGERNLSIDMNRITRPQIESRATDNKRQSNNNVRSDERQREKGIQSESSQQGQSRESKPQINEQKSRRERQEMRRELIQRHDNKQNSSPPVNRETKQQQVERRTR